MKGLQKKDDEEKHKIYMTENRKKGIFSTEKTEGKTEKEKTNIS